MRALLRHRDARLWLAGQTLSRFGDRALYLALGIWVFGLTHSSSYAGLTFFVLALPSLAAPLAGLLADRVRRRPLLIATDLVVAASLALLLLVHDRGGLPVVYAVTLVYGATALVFASGQSALLTVMLPPEQLGYANGLLGSVDEVSRLVAPLFGAGLFTAFGIGAVVAFDAASFVASAACLALLRVREPAPVPSTLHWRTQAMGGLRHIRATRPLARVVGSTAVMLLVVGWSETAIFALISRGLHRGVALLGVLSPVQGVGAIVGGLVAGRVLRRVGDGRLMGLGALACAAGIALLCVPLLPVVLVGLLPTGFGLAWVLVAYSTSIQLRTPAPLQGRVYAAAELVAGVPQTLGIATGAVLVTVVDYRLLYGVMALVTAAVGARLLVRTPREPAAVGPAGAGSVAALVTG